MIINGLYFYVFRSNIRPVTFTGYRMPHISYFVSFYLLPEKTQVFFLTLYLKGKAFLLPENQRFSLTSFLKRRKSFSKFVSYADHEVASAGGFPFHHIAVRTA